MKIKIPSITTSKKILAAVNPPRGATHFRFTARGRSPVIDVLKNIDVLAGCSGILEFGKKERGDIAWFAPAKPKEEAQETLPNRTSQ